MMLRMKTVRPLVLVVALLAVGASTAWSQPLTVSAAISMKDAVDELGRGFTASRPGVTLAYNWGSSGELQRQIEAGAPVDLFISAALSPDGRAREGGS